MLRLLVLTTFIIITLTVNPYLFPQVNSTAESSSPSSDSDSDNDGSKPQDEAPQDNSEGTDSGSDGAAPTSGDAGTPPDGAEPPGEVGPVSGGDDEEQEEKKVCVTNKEGVKFCFEKLPIDETPCPEPIVVEDPPLNPDIVCMPPKEGIDTGNISTMTISELMNQTDSIDNNNATKGEMVMPAPLEP